jgi:SAM-dependent methyltransferase
VDDAPNRYSPRWAQVFLLTHDAAQTQREADFLRRQLPLPRFARVLDVCCGVGRHAAPLLEAGYEVTGIDRDQKVLDEARRRCPRGNFVQLDMRRIDQLEDLFDAVICMWQSFGYFDAATNESTLAQMAGRLVSNGRLVLDVYHRECFQQGQGVRTFECNGVNITETKRMIGDRLHVSLDYEPGEHDEFEWQLFTSESLTELAAKHGLRRIVACTGAQETQAPSAQASRMQLVFEKLCPP